MITILNRTELLHTFSMQRQAQVRNAFDQQKIDYALKTINRKSPSPLAAGSRAKTGTLGENLEMNLEYVVYVKKEDYDRASLLIQ